MFESNIPSELPPRPPRAFFGRNELVDQIVGLAEDLTPLALIGPGGIGKTSIALTVLHHDRIKQRFGDDRRFIRCDQFPASLSHFLNRLSAVTGADIENPKDLTPLQPFLSSKEVLIVLDNAESILDPEGTDSQEIYAVVEELSQFDNICLCITSRISTIPPDCELLDIPTLSMEAARDAFYGIYKNGKRSDAVNNILEQLDFHPLSITLLATVAHQNRWDASRLTREWESRRTGVLQTDHKKSLAATIELSLASPMFQELGPDARALLEVVAFFPQGVDENHLDWLLPAIPDRENIFDKFCVLSLTHRNNKFVTMLAPLRDCLYPKDPKSSPLLCAVKERFFIRLSADIDPDKPGSEETQWIMSEDVNVEHLLDAFASADANSNDVWDAFANFMRHINRHKPRLVILGPKVEGLPDDHPSKPRCLVGLSKPLFSVGNFEENKRLLVHALSLWRKRGVDPQVARTLRDLARANRVLGLYEEGILRAEEALGIYERLDDTVGQVDSLQLLALLLAKVGQVDAAEEAVSRAANLLPDKPSQYQLCWHYYTLGYICAARGEMEAAINHHEKAFKSASSVTLRIEQVSILRCLVVSLLDAGRLDDARVHLERLKSDGVNDPLSLTLAVVVQARVWCQQGRFEEARSEVSSAISTTEKFGASKLSATLSKELFRTTKEEMNKSVIGEGELLRTVLPLASTNSFCTESER